jgi:nitrogen fixation NifU-like protein
MSDLADLYQQVILDHNRRPRNFGKLEDATQTVQGFNPLCGDQLTLYLKVEGDRIADIRFEGEGCAISKASASLMTDDLKGKTTAEATAVFERMHRVLTGEADAEDEAALGKLAVFLGVRQFPARVKCASLSWHALHNALAGNTTTATTE